MKNYLFISLSLLILFHFHCSTSNSKEMEAEVMTDTNYGYFRWHNSIRDGYVVVDTKVFKDPSGCHGDYNCSSQEHIKKMANLRPSDPSMAIPLKVGEYYAMTKLRYGDVSFFRCKTSDLKIYHGFQFKDPYDPKNPTVPYTSETCQFLKEDKVVCPSIKISKKNIQEINITEDEIREKSISFRHLLESNIILSTISLFYCGPISSQVDFISVEDRRY
ncbi:hypothetical protein ND861_09540 [Leptospira sp. 2 VSF19]|uniref:Lipoprotein n=1 Tax=Leptospira soteropolitanensis TaxID=2950025 RepID=A0AAW5VDK2_9LEPT|nr:hypothetical protein [Leptospira soteropolitanensis]MCW7492552.1 hypothetical protein [Leptospira soteropolitanensis]MCW7500600.1 hypothetical protein [Leptospira soteropolitanensis]MCW7522730.1 hypothetical protein [Leptospira soteropolitanensis]MCW7526586.1 hypothetical protein [Leptospira soteropolitanensis]MCW7530570.1 hypothetical protein [Leptospira soteropolitanensis]